MDRFTEERPELIGSLVSMEFGNGGRISQLWASDPALPDEGEDFQFVLPAISFGEESSEDYCPGTILLGVRTDPDGPWIVSRNNSATVTEPESDEYDANVVVFQYEFPLIDELTVTAPAPIPARKRYMMMGSPQLSPSVMVISALHSDDAW